MPRPKQGVGKPSTATDPLPRRRRGRRSLTTIASSVAWQLGRGAPATARAKAHSRSNAAWALSTADRRERVRTARADDVGRNDASSSASDATAGKAQETGAPRIARDEPGP